MSVKFRRRFRIESARLPGWDYGQSGIYFITICTALRKPSFGQICNGQMYLSDLGRIAFDLWNLIPERFDYIRLDSFIIQPDHLHGILIIDNPKNNSANAPDFPCFVETRLIASLQNRENLAGLQKFPGGITGSQNPMLRNNISRVIRWYKGRCTYEIRKIQPDFKWQTRFHDRIIRSSPERFIMRLYISWHPPILK